MDADVAARLHRFLLIRCLDGPVYTVSGSLLYGSWAVGIGYASPARIDEINILQATYEAMREAISKLSVKPDVLLNDAVKIPQVDIRQVPIIKGDAKSVSIAAASIVAKVTRDRLMEEYDKVLPGYGFASNKGYGSAEHIAALKKSARHRSTGSRLSAISCKGTASKRRGYRI